MFVTGCILEGPEPDALKPVVLQVLEETCLCDIFAWATREGEVTCMPLRCIKPDFRQQTRIDQKPLLEFPWFYRNKIFLTRAI